MSTFVHNFVKRKKKEQLDANWQFNLKVSLTKIMQNNAVTITSSYIYSEKWVTYLF